MTSTLFKGYKRTFLTCVVPFFLITANASIYAVWRIQATNDKQLNKENRRFFLVI
jgi:hypothetical protein